MSKEHMGGDATGYKRGAKGIDGEGKPLAKYGPQRFQHYLPAREKQAATVDKVSHGKSRYPKEGKPRNWGIDSGKGAENRRYAPSKEGWR
jgi:hypothetical protein